MNIAGLLKTATIDFPHRLAAVVFTAGCNYDCSFCHNRALLGAAELMEDGEVLRFLEKRAGLLDGVVISGGEPTLQKDLAEFAGTLKGLGYDVKLDTNGSDPEAVGRLLDGGLVDYVAMDYKAPFSRYPEICGAGRLFGDAWLAAGLGDRMGAADDRDPRDQRSGAAGDGGGRAAFAPLCFAAVPPGADRKAACLYAAGYWADSGSAEGSPAQCDCTVLK